jgi:hypothetical protein
LGDQLFVRAGGPARSAVWELALKKVALLWAAIGLALATPAYADPIVLFGLSPNDIVFTSIGGDKLEVTLPVGISGSATFQADVGAFLIGMTNFTAGPLSGQIFPANGTEPFSYNSGVDFDALRGVVTWNAVNNDFGGEPILAGTLAIGSSTGDADFVSDYPAGGHTAITMFFPVNCSLAALASNGCPAMMEIGSFEGGDVTPGPVPEPGSFGLLGTFLGIMLSAAHPSYFLFRSR